MSDRSVLAESIFASMLEACDQPLEVAVESASVGPALDGQHDARVAQARSLSLRVRCFHVISVGHSSPPAWGPPSTASMTPASPRWGLESDSEK